MRRQSGEFLRKLMEKQEFEKVLEVGSLDVNGNVKEYVTFKNYIGTDMREGRNVEIVINGHNLTDKFEKESFDLVICFDTFEHDDKFWLTLEQMKKVLKTGGYLIIGAPGRNCPQHDHPNDYWRFMPSSFEFFFEDMEDTYLEKQTDDQSHIFEDEIYGWGRKK